MKPRLLWLVGAVLVGLLVLRSGSSGRRNAERPAPLPGGDVSAPAPELAVPAFLDVESDCLRLDEPVCARPGERDVVLRPEGLGVVRGRIVLAPGTESAGDFSFEAVELWWEVPSAKRWIQVPGPDGRVVETATWDGNRSLEWVEADGHFELALLPTGVELALEASLPDAEVVVERLAPLAPGESREIVLTLARPAARQPDMQPDGPRRTVAGRVIDEQGRGMPTTIWIEREEEEGDVAEGDVDEEPGADFYTSASTDEAGAFEVAGLEAGRATVGVRGRNLVRADRLVVDTTFGDVRGLVLSVVRGECIEGTVVWPDGSPVETFQLSCGYDREAGVDGRFRWCGFVPGVVPLSVEASKPGLRGSLALESVQAGARDLRLVLEVWKTHELRGRVVGTDGSPLRASLYACGRHPGHAYEESSAETDPDGAFLLDALCAGEWRIDVESPGWHRLELRTVLPGRDLELVLEPACRIQGLVLDPGGAPVAEARVGRMDVRTDAAGRFSLESDAALLSLRAWKSGFASSEDVELQAPSGGLVEGVVLRLLPACRVDGRVFDSARRSAVGSEVVLARDDGSEWNREVDEEGRFSFEDLPPGRATLYVLRDDRSGPSLAVELAPGTPAHVELESPE